jgi:hypothetical protein
LQFSDKSPEKGAGANHSVLYSQYEKNTYNSKGESIGGRQLYLTRSFFDQWWRQYPNEDGWKPQKFSCWLPEWGEPGWDYGWSGEVYAHIGDNLMEVGLLCRLSVRLRKQNLNILLCLIWFYDRSIATPHETQLKGLESFTWYGNSYHECARLYSNLFENEEIMHMIIGSSPLVYISLVINDIEFWELQVLLILLTKLPNLQKRLPAVQLKTLTFLETWQIIHLLEYFTLGLKEAHVEWNALQ